VWVFSDDPHLSGINKDKREIERERDRNSKTETKRRAERERERENVGGRERNFRSGICRQKMI
jgi:hypothetical protein